MRTKRWAVGAAIAAALGAMAAVAGRTKPAPPGTTSGRVPPAGGPPPSPDADPFGAIDAARERLRRNAEEQR